MHFFFPSRTLDDSLYTILKWCMDKYAQAFIVEDVIGASANDHTIFFLSSIQNNLSLKIKEHIIHGNKVKIAVHLKFMVNGKTPLAATFLINLGKQIKRNILFLSCNIDQLFVIKSKSSSSARALPIRRPLLPSILFIVITRLLIIKPSFMTSLLLNDIDSGGYSQIVPVICN